MNREPRILAEREKNGVIWQARIGTDRGRLEVVALVPPSTGTTIVEALTGAELQELLEDR